MSNNKVKNDISLFEFVFLMAFLTAFMALSIDAILPALRVMGNELQVVEQNTVQLVISFIFIGLALSKLAYGPIADAIGRKKSIYSAIFLFGAGSVMSWLAQDFTIMLAGRIIQGIGLGGITIITTAMVRDKYSGADMARVMSLIMVIFILSPTIAPTVGQAILKIADWRSIFSMFVVFSVIGAVWMYVRMPETLKPENQIPLNAENIWSGMKEVCLHRVAFGYTICTGLVFGAFIGYLNSCQQIFQDTFLVGDMFPVYFGLLALSFGLSFIINSVLVRKHGMVKLTAYSHILMIVCTALYLGKILMSDATLVGFIIYVLVTFFCLGIIFGNLNSMAMEPMGHIAGMAAGVIGTISNVIALLIGTAIGQYYDGTVVPLIIGLLSMSILSYLTMLWIEQKNECHMSKQET